MILQFFQKLPRFSNILKRQMTKLSSFNADLQETLESELDEKVAGRLKTAFAESFEGKDINLTNLFQQPNNNIHQVLKKQIAKLPTLNYEKLDGLGLSGSSITQLKNVIAVTDKYNAEFSADSPVQPKNSVPLTEQIKEIKKQLKENGVEVTDSVQIPATKKWGQEFTLAIPEEYEVAAIHLKLPDKKERNYTRTYLKHKKIRLQKNTAGELGVRVLLKLKDETSNIDVFQPVTWSWKMHQKDTGEFDLPDPEPDPEPEPEPENPEEPEEPEDRKTR